MDIKIALAGNPNCGKTTLFNLLTGSNQYVGNWPGVTVEKKEGKLKKYDGVTVTDLPGIYSLAPYTPEEIVARKYLVEEYPDVILNIVDGSNLERNLYLTTQLIELGAPVVIAVNMMDIVRKRGDSIDTKVLSEKFDAASLKFRLQKMRESIKPLSSALKHQRKKERKAIKRTDFQELSSMLLLILKRLFFTMRRLFRSAGMPSRFLNGINLQ